MDEKQLIKFAWPNRTMSTAEQQDFSAASNAWVSAICIYKYSIHTEKILCYSHYNAVYF